MLKNVANQPSEVGEVAKNGGNALGAVVLVDVDSDRLGGVEDVSLRIRHAAQRENAGELDQDKGCKHNPHSLRNGVVQSRGRAGRMGSLPWFQRVIAWGGGGDAVQWCHPTSSRESGNPLECEGSTNQRPFGPDKRSGTPRDSVASGRFHRGALNGCVPPALCAGFGTVLTPGRALS